MDVEFEYSVALKFKQTYEGAKERKIEFNLSISDMRKLMLAKKCAYTGMELTDDNTPQGQADFPNKRTLDRIDSNKGYVRGNVVACSHIINKIKNYACENENGSLFIGNDMFFKFAKSYEKKLKETKNV